MSEESTEKPVIEEISLKQSIEVLQKAVCAPNGRFFFAVLDPETGALLTDQRSNPLLQSFILATVGAEFHAHMLHFENQKRELAAKTAEREANPPSQIVLPDRGIVIGHS